MAILHPVGNQVVNKVQVKWKFIWNISHLKVGFGSGGRYLRPRSLLRTTKQVEWTRPLIHQIS